MRSIEPALSLEQMIEEWNEISESLAEAPRTRLNDHRLKVVGAAEAA
jgi:hypothetical protein